MRMTRQPDGAWLITLDVTDVQCVQCWAAVGEPCVNENGSVLAVPPLSKTYPREPCAHPRRWIRAGTRRFRAKHSPVAVRSRRLYGKDWNPWPEDYDLVGMATCTADEFALNDIRSYREPREPQA